MKITDITTEAFRWPRAKPIANGKHTYTHSGLGLVHIHTDAGITGIGLGNTDIGRFTKELIGEDPIDVERLWHKMWVPKLVGRRGQTVDLLVEGQNVQLAGLVLAERRYL